ncbi:MAG TPA: hypothetical protein VLF21_02295 [Candidatus Saccharimonadales bacterium]|nr:hypothetical protein [Candidatus Saccharimonadales bacterium]
MTYVPLKITIVGSLAVAGVLAMAVHPASKPASRNSQIDVKQNFTGQGVVENPPAEVTVNGQPVEVKGSTTVDTGAGTATIQVTPHTAQVSAPATTDGISVQISQTNSGNGGTHTSLNAQSSSHFSSSSHSSVWQEGSGTISVQTH